VMFVDDDVYMCPGWDERLVEVYNQTNSLNKHGIKSIISGHAHPYNHTVVEDWKNFIKTTVLSTVHLFMDWDVWDTVGFFAEPGGPGGSEDVDYCKRATNQEMHLIVTKPQCVIHAGMTNSKGERIVGYEQVAKRNQEIQSIYGLTGKVTYS